ncbi:MAG: type II toxin-antitoxin system Phd/YefM family antitoxin [Treponema sp.]|nr:type II toxin-antitoxin system Phd/YefM family antitoxin [Treponema sp.]
METIPIFEAKNKLPAIIHQIEGGEGIELTRHNKGVAVLLSKDMYSTLNNDSSFESAFRLFRRKYSDLYNSEESQELNQALDNHRQNDQGQEVELW